MNGIVEKHFEKIGARVRIRPLDPPRTWSRRSLVQGPLGLRMDVRRDRRGEYFDIAIDVRQTTLEVLDARPRQRHLLLLSRHNARGTKEKFLCGHDERHWFVAAIPGRSAATVLTALEALKPPAVREAQARHAVPAHRRNRRHNPAFVRQGEWFFVPAATFPAQREEILRREPIRRGGSKAHVVEYVFRTGGETVYVSHLSPNGLSQREYEALLARNPAARRARWQVMRRNAGVFARGRVWHPDHRTITLNGWHRVLPNTETEAPAMRNVAFLD
ncbi:MAG TPA: hypothetical protein PLP66_10510 [Phycisphaerae bacterium]|nr:hypothetical protein [Phycisphaerae bacterium]